MTEKVAKVLKAGMIRPSRSPWAAGVVLTRKKDGPHRFYIDYRRLNDLTVADSNPMPRIDEALAAMQGAGFFSVFDMASGYWQVAVAEDVKPKTVFVTREGLFEWNRMACGLKCAPAKVLAGLTYTDCLVYMDDVLVFSKTVDEHLAKLERVFQRFRQHCLTVNSRKTTLLQRETTFLGHQISAEGVRPDCRLVEAVAEQPVPKDKATLRTFLGLAGCYCHFIPGVAAITAPLSDLTAKAAEWRWREEHQQAFENIRARLTERPVLGHPDFSRPFVVQTDYSSRAIGAVLSQ